MRSILALLLVAGCSKGKTNESPPAGSAAPSAGSAASAAANGSGSAAGAQPEATAWAKDKPATVPDEAIAVLDALESTHAARHADLISPDCAVETEAIKALTPRVVALTTVADKLDQIHDPEAVGWLTAVYNPRIKDIFHTIFVQSIRPTPCKPDPAYKAAAMEYVKASGWEPKKPEPEPQ